MLRDQITIGNYLDGQNFNLQISPGQRTRMVEIIQVLHKKKGYRLETEFLAVNIADRYLRNLSEENKRGPCLVLLALTSLIIAAK